MLDSNEQAKGGFGAFAARDRERRDEVAAASAATAQPAAAAAPIIDEQADGTPAAEPEPAPLPSAAPTGRQPKRWR
jgi:hypothetical protein